MDKGNKENEFSIKMNVSIFFNHECVCLFFSFFVCVCVLFVTLNGVFFFLD
jgi:hypothetical protein